MTTPARVRRRSILASSVAMLLGVTILSTAPRASADQYWDGLGGNTTTIEGGGGTWNSIIQNWTNSTGTTNSLYDSAQISIFSAPGGVVKLGGNISFAGLRFLGDGYEILPGSSSYTLSPINTATVEVAANKVAYIGAAIVGTGGLNITGPGRLTLAGASTYSGGTTLDGVTVFANTNGAFGTGLITVTANGATIGTSIDETKLSNSIKLGGNLTIKTVINTGSSTEDFFFNGPIDLNGGPRTITGTRASSQIHFGGVISNGDLTLKTNFTSSGDYVAFIFDTGTVTGTTTTIGNGAFLVLPSTTTTLQGDNVVIEGNGVIEYFDLPSSPAGTGDQIDDNATVTVNSQGNFVGSQRNTGLDLAGKSDTIGALNGNGTVAVGGGTLTVGAGNFTGVISDGYLGNTNGNLTKNTGGTLILSGANRYTGATTVQAGTLQAGAANTFSKASSMVINGGTLDLNNFNQTVGSLGGAGGTVTLGSATLTTGFNNTDSSYAGSIQGTGGLTKVGTGVMTLTGVNTYTGATTVNKGTLVVDTATNGNVIDAGSKLVMGGGTFRLVGKATANQGQVLNGLTLNGGANVISVDNNSGASTTLDLGAGGTQVIVRNNQSTVDFKSASGAPDDTVSVIKTFQATPGLIGSWATVNNGKALAAVDNNGNIVAYTGYTDIDATGPNTILDGSATDVRITTPGATSDPVLIDAATTNINTLTQDSATDSVIDTSPGTLRLGASGGIFITADGKNLTIGTAPNSGVLTAGGGVVDTAGEIVVGNFSTTSTLVINSVIADNGTGQVSLTKTGAGVLTLTAANTYTGTTAVNQGTLNLNTTGANAIVGNVQVNGGTLIWNQADQILDTKTLSVSGGTANLGSNNETVAGVQLTGGTITGTTGILTSTTNPYDMQAGTADVILAGAVGLNKTTDGTVILSKNNTYTGPTIISGGTLQMGIANAVASGSAITVNANGTLALSGFSQQVASIAGTGLIDLGSGTLSVGNTNLGSTFDGVIQGTGGLTKEGTGVLVLNQKNLYTGATSITGGTVQAGIVDAIHSRSAMTIATGATFDLNDFNQQIGSLAGAGNVDLGTATLTVGASATTTFSGVITGAGGLTKVGLSSLTLTGQNTYTGPTRVDGGSLFLEGALVSVVTLDNGSLLSVAAGGKITVGDNVNMVTLIDGAAVKNSGTMTAGNNLIGISGTDGHQILNEGTLTVGNASTAIKLLSDNQQTAANNAAVVNTGSIVTGNQSTGIDVVDSNTVYTKTMTVGSDSTGVRLVSQNTFTNAGTMTFGTGSIGIDVQSGNTLSNSGTLSGAFTGTTGLILRGKDNTFVNQVGALVSASKAVTLTATSGANTIVNYGTMTGVSGVAIDASLTPMGINFVNLGVPGANFDTNLLDLKKLNIINAGVLNGDILFGAGDDIATLATGGSWKGKLDGAGGNNTLRLIGTGQDTLDISTVTNFDYLTKRGGGTWKLNGTSTFSGGSNIEAGTLAVQGNLISNVRIWSEGILGGTGMVTGNVVNVGTLNPGNSPGKITINGNYDQQRSGTMVIEVAGKGAGQHDLVDVSGRAKLDGTLRVEKVGKAPRLKIGDRITFLTAKGGVEGEFSKLQDNYTTGSMIKAEVVYESNQAYLEGVQGSFTQFADQSGLTPNQHSTAQAIDAAVAAGKDKKIVQYLNNRDIQDIPKDLDRIAPEELTAMYHVGVSLANVQAQNIDRRLDDLRITNRRLSSQTPVQANTAPGAGGPAGVDGTAGKTVAVPLQQRDRWGTFFTGTGQISKVGQTDNARGYDLDTGGLTVGVDYLVTDHLAVGLTVGYANTTAKLADDGRIQVNGGKIGAYGTYFLDGFHVDAAVNGGFNSYDVKRAALDGTARGQTEGFEFSAHVGAGYDWKVEEFTLSPMASVQYTYVGFDDFQEHGSISPLKIPAQHSDSISSTLGVKAAYDWDVAGKLVRPELSLAWRHEYGDRSFSIDSELPSGSGGIFTVTDSEIGRDSLLLTAGVSVIWSPTTVFYLFYDGELERKEYQAHNLSGGMRLSF